MAERYYRKITVCSEDSGLFRGAVSISVGRQSIVGNLDRPTRLGVKSGFSSGAYSEVQARNIGKMTATELDNLEIPVIEFAQPKHPYDESFMEGFVEGIKEARGLDSKE